MLNCFLCFAMFVFFYCFLLKGGAKCGATCGDVEQIGIFAQRIKLYYYGKVDIIK